jgi:hypothetical protein
MQKQIYLAGKIAGIYLWHCLLQRYGLLTYEFKFWSFVIVTPIVKYFTMPISAFTFAISCLTDLAMALMYHGLLVTLTGDWFPMTTFLLGFSILFLELFQYSLTPGDHYHARFSHNPTDYLLAAVIASIHYAASRFYTWDPTLTPENLLGIYACFLGFEALFGWFHYLEHNIPWLWNHHKVHHEYKAAELCSVANFYASFSDSLMMNSGTMSAALTTVLLGPTRCHWLALTDMIYSAFVSHSKYQKHQMHSVLNFESDCVDLLLGKERISAFHHEHHDKTGSRFGAWGWISDEFYANLMGRFVHPVE